MRQEKRQDATAATCPPNSALADVETPPAPRRRQMLLAAASVAAPSLPRLAFGQGKIDVTIGGSTGIGISYLPLLMMVEDKLLEKHAAALGVEVTARWQRFPRAAAMHDALVSGSLDFASGGVSQLLASWDKTRTTVKVRGVGALVSMPIYLVSSNPHVKTVADFSAKDKIAVPEVRTSIQAVVLAMAAEKAFGKGQGSRLDPYCVAMGHPEAMAALVSGKSDVDAHFSAAPIMFEELARPGIHRVLDSYEVLGGPHTYNAVWTTTRFHDANPKVYAAFAGALKEADELIKADPATAAAVWMKAENVKTLTAKEVEDLVRNPEIEWTTTPRKFTAFASFMNQAGLLPSRPGDWHDFFFDDMAGRPGDRPAARAPAVAKDPAGIAGARSR
jgi:NitT/TauT family transport system substrate-binding protein